MMSEHRLSGSIVDVVILFQPAGVVYDPLKIGFWFGRHNSTHGALNRWANSTEFARYSPAMTCRMPVGKGQGCGSIVIGGRHVSPFVLMKTVHVVAIVDGVGMFTQKNKNN